VHCRLSGFEPELEDRSQSLNAVPPFHDCTVTFSDGTKMTSCWSGPKDAYEMAWIPQEADSASSQSGCGALLFKPVTTTTFATVPGPLSYG
jgi:hypothetical protein